MTFVEVLVGIIDMRDTLQVDLLVSYRWRHDWWLEACLGLQKFDSVDLIVRRADTWPADICRGHIRRQQFVLLPPIS